MKYLLIVIAVLGLIYVVFIDISNTEIESDQPDVLYQKEVEKAKAVESFLQETVDQRFEEMDRVK